MMSETLSRGGLADRLPEVRGRYSFNAPLATITWFRAGGAAEVLFRPADRDDLLVFLKARPAEVPVTLLGVGSNLLVRDGGVPGVVIRLGRAFAGIEIREERVTAGAGALDITVALAAGEAEVAGLEFLRGIPGTIGGALRMNAGAYGVEVKDVLVEALVADAAGQCRRLAGAELGLSYRHCALPEGSVFLEATFAGRQGTAADIAARMAEISAARASTQPIRSRTGGSTFANPDPVAAKGAKAWQLIEAAGCRGLRIGQAQVSEQHCNFLINTGGASAAEIEALGEEVRRRVLDHSGIRLEWEIRRIGRPVAGGRTPGAGS